MLPPKLTLCLLGEAAFHLEQTTPNLSWQRHHNPDSITAPADIIVLGATSSEQCQNWLQTLRARTDIGQQPIFRLGSSPDDDPTVNALLDGHWDNLASRLEWLQRWQERQRQFVLEHPNSELQSVLHYLWTRPHGTLAPVADWRVSQLYRYPLLECITGSNDAAYLLLEQLTTRRLLRPGKLFDRVRTCPGCHSGHLSYVDQCPGCHSLDIGQQPAIHCFNCGHVASQQHFSRNGVLQCPNCHTRLRHIGTDYDRPMENHQCNSCQLMFIEPDIRARCLSCHSSHQPEALRTEQIHDYQLSDIGARLCREGDVAWNIGNLVLLGSLIPQEMFRFSLEWFDHLCVRYPAQSYSLIAIRLANVPDMVARNGFKESMLVLENLGQDLRAQLRNTDLCTQLAEDLLLLLLPNTPAAHVDVLRQKISNTHLHSSDRQQEQLKIHIASYSSSPQKHSAQHATQLIDMLANEVRS